ncbi:hypothetical protein WJX81_003880 [Elliptochloris bilobata]|uniref:Cytochrome c-553 n=1 Tax=Elliptochloris bilobata TaxID=381761 RepID=A0AAW1RVP2_9CHLO
MAFTSLTVKPAAFCQPAWPTRVSRRNAPVCKAEAKGLAWAVDRATAGKGALLTAAGLYAAMALAAGSADLAAGQEVFDGNCAACHTGGLNSVQQEKTLSKESLVKYLDGGFSIDAIVHQVENGKNAMPAWAGRLDDEEIQNVAAYVYNQADTNGW